MADDVVIRLILDTARYVQPSKQAAQATSQIQQTAKGASQGLSSMTTAMKGVAVAAGGAFAVKKFGQEVFDAARRAEQLNSQYAITEQVIRQTGGAAGLSALEVKDMNRQLALQTGIDKELVSQGANVLLTFKNISNVVGEGNDIFHRAQRASMDLSATLGTQLKSAALQVGKALNDPIKGVTALAEAGVQFTEDQREQIRVLVETGRTLDAQKIILEEIESQVGGTAEASADATAKISVAWQEIQEQLGNKVLPLIERAADEIPDLFAKMERGAARFNLGALRLNTWGPFTGISEEVDKEMIALAEAHVLYLNAVGEGIPRSQALAQSIGEIAARGQLTSKNVRELQEQVGASNMEMQEAATRLKVWGQAMGLTGEQLRHIEALTLRFTGALTPQEIAAQRAADMVDYYSRNLGDVEAGADGAAEAVFDLNAALYGEIGLVDQLIAKGHAIAEHYNILGRLQTGREEGTLAGGSGITRRRAAGGWFHSGDALIVGERGPEILYPRTSGFVQPNMGGSTEIHIHQPNTTDLRQDIRAGLIASGVTELMAVRR